MFESMFTICASALYLASNTDRDRNNNQTTTKKYLSVQCFLSICRLRSVRELTIWAMAEGLSHISRGIPYITNNTSAIMRYSLTYPIILCKLTAMVPMVRERE